MTASPRQRWDNGPVNTLTPILSSPGWELLESLQARQETNPMPLRELGAALRASGIEASLAAAVLTQLALRQAARAKFGPFASHMVFTRDGLEQATRLVVAARHAQRFRASGARRVADLGCGIGADALAIAGLGGSDVSNLQAGILYQGVIADGVEQMCFAHEKCLDLCGFERL